MNLAAQPVGYDIEIGSEGLPNNCVGFDIKRRAVPRHLHKRVAGEKALEIVSSTVFHFSSFPVDLLWTRVDDDHLHNGGYLYTPTTVFFSDLALYIHLD